MSTSTARGDLFSGALKHAVDQASGASRLPNIVPALNLEEVRRVTAVESDRSGSTFEGSRGTPGEVGAAASEASSERGAGSTRTPRAAVDGVCPCGRNVQPLDGVNVCIC